MALVLVIDTVTVIPECNLNLNKKNTKYDIISFWQQIGLYHNSSYDDTNINMLTRVPHVGLHPSLLMIKLL